jgi:hypothetical protein
MHAYARHVDTQLTAYDPHELANPSILQWLALPPLFLQPFTASYHTTSPDPAFFLVRQQADVADHAWLA